MSVHRMRREDVCPVQVPAEGGVVIAIGDLVWLNSEGNVEPAATIPWDTNLNTTRRNFKEKFVGVSLDKRLSSQAAAGVINVATRGRYRVPCATDASARPIGTLYGPAKQTGNALESQRVDVVSSVAHAIGVLTKPRAAGDTEVELEIISTVIHRGAQNVILS